MNLLNIKSDISVLEKNFDLYLSKLLNLRKDHHYHHNRKIEIEPSHPKDLTEVMTALKGWRETEEKKTNIFISSLRSEKHSYTDYAREFIGFEEY